LSCLASVATICYAEGMTDGPPGEARDPGVAIKRGLRGRCPACGGAALFGRFLKTETRCPACGQNWDVHCADDMPAYLVILVIGHILVPFVVMANLRFDLGMGVQMLLWPTIAILLAMILIQPAKGAVIAFQWARRMHGFSRGR